jgi:hypothetical protein
MRVTADAGLHVLPRDGRRLRPALAEHRDGRRELAVEGLLDGEHLERRAEIVRDPLGGVARGVAVEARRHVEREERGLHLRDERVGVEIRVDLAERAPRHEQRQQRVAPAREREPDALESARLAVVVGDAERERLVEIVEQLVARAATGRTESAQRRRSAARRSGVRS